MNHQIDPFESAANPEVPVPEYYGQALTDAFYCVLQRGVGKMPFDATQHRVEDRRTAVKISIIPIPEQNARDVTREYIAEFGAWVKITLPSIKAIGLEPKTLNNAWVRAALVPEGKTYTDKAGEIKESLTLKFLAAYPDEAACRAAYLAARNGSAAETPAETPQPASNGDDKERTTALEFVKALIKQTNGDEAALATRIASLAPVAKHFNVQSPEVRALLDAYQFEHMAA